LKNLNSNIAIKISGVSKQYMIVDTNKVTTLTGLLHIKNKKKFWALEGISLEILKGESLGIIGPNGAGKSTLLKILSGITKPTAGKVEIFGSIASVLEIGLGFHPDLTGRENVFLSGSLLGFNKEHIQKRFKHIVEFSEIGDFIDTPVKHYSSGMFIRLAFSLVSNIDADIMLFDEALNVGDSAFQQKSSKKILELLSAKKTIIIVSHNLNDIMQLCSKVVYLENGKISSNGNINQTISMYLKSIETHQIVRNSKQLSPKDILRINETLIPMGVSIISIGVTQDGKIPEGAIELEKDFKIDFIFQKFNDKFKINISVNLAHMGFVFLSTNSLQSSADQVYIKESGEYSVSVEFPKFLFNTNEYSADVFISCEENFETLHIKSAFSFLMIDNLKMREHQIFSKLDAFPGPLNPIMAWEINKK